MVNSDAVNMMAMLNNLKTLEIPIELDKSAGGWRLIHKKTRRWYGPRYRTVKEFVVFLAGFEAMAEMIYFGDATVKTQK